MNTPNNKRRKESQRRIESAFVNLIQTRDLAEIRVSDICKDANVNRSTFYANYLDVYDLADKIGEKLTEDVQELYAEERAQGYNSFDFLKIVQNIYDNRLFYRTYFKLGMDKVKLIDEYDYHAARRLYDDKHIDYHIEFFMAGFNAMVKKWLLDDCPFPPEEFVEILHAEYVKDLSDFE